MKRRLSYLLIVVCLLLVAACKNSPAVVEKGTEGCEGEKAKAILWVDFKKGRIIPDGTRVSRVKVYAQVYADGTVKILSFCKKQPMKVENYLLKRLEAYTIRKGVFEEKYLEPGEQYLQLQYIPDWMK